MNLKYTARARLLAGALVVVGASALTMNSMQQAEAQPRRATWEQSAQWLACGSSTVQAMRRVRANAISTNVPDAVRRSLRDLGNVNTPSADLALAAGACRDEQIRDRRHNIAAYLCVGDAGLMSTVSSVDRDSNAQNSYCAYHSAALLAGQVRDARQLGAAHLGRARALRALSASQDDVAAAYTAAINADPSANEARFELARIYRTSNPTRAQDLLVRSQGGNFVPVVQGVESAVAIIEFARARSATPDIRLLRAAQQAAPDGNVGVNSALGVAYFDSNPPEARGFLVAATNPGAVPRTPVETELQREAYYYRSILDLDQRATFADAVRFADLAGNPPHALRQACLARLRQGGAAVYNRVRVAGVWQDEGSEAQNSCSLNRLGATPEGNMLVGMYWLRRAQYLAQQYGSVTPTGRQQVQRAVANADRAFSDARNALVDNTAKLNWPGQDRDITLRLMLEYADRLRQYYASSCQIGSTPSGDPRAEQIFEYYQIIRPRSVTLRCLPEANT